MFVSFVFAYAQQLLQLRYLSMLIGGVVFFFVKCSRNYQNIAVVTAHEVRVVCSVFGAFVK